MRNDPKTDPGAHQASYTLGTVGLLREFKLTLRTRGTAHGDLKYIVVPCMTY
ncbi:hypothetical protein L798_15520 [Zootermopsis nevadensis]|uniref:Uncharacterized protein n=1 Tax=Zootermopsis nevadensis TaxID=136037 RepID=A0A067QZA5_ZOONE|nr:hypothetical protein L798_15520 [Zootermopsis nevadensis]